MDNNARHVVTGRVRLSYVNVFNPKPGKDGGDPKYSVTVLMPKGDSATKMRLDAAISAAIADGVSRLWQGVRPPILAIPMYDGDGGRPSDGLAFGAECKGHWVFTAASKRPPQIIDLGGNPIVGQSEVYSGIYAHVGLDFFAYNNQKKGVGCSLSSIIKIENGEPLGYTIPVSEDLAAITGQCGAIVPLFGQYGPAVIPYAAPAPTLQAGPYTPVDPITGLPAR